MPGLAGTANVSSEAIKRQSRMLEVIRRGCNSKLKLLQRVSDPSGNLSVNCLVIDDQPESNARVSVIKELVKCLEGEYAIEGFSREDMKLICDYVACY